MISTAIYSLLYADTSIRQLVYTRIYPEKAAQGDAMPYIVYSQISQTPTDSKTNGTGFDRYRVQVTAVAESYTTCETLGGLIRTALDRKTGTYGSLVVTQIVYEDTNDIPFGLQEDSIQLYGRAVDFIVTTK